MARGGRGPARGRQSSRALYLLPPAAPGRPETAAAAVHDAHAAVRPGEPRQLAEHQPPVTALVALLGLTNLFARRRWMSYFPST